MSSTLAERQAGFEVVVAPEADESWIDRSQIHRALLNLLTNALDAMGNGGRLLVQVSLDREAPLPGSVPLPPSAAPSGSLRPFPPCRPRPAG